MNSWIKFIESKNRLGSFLVLGAIIISVLMLGQYPFQTSDFINYIFSARIFSVYKQNPYLLTPNDFSNDLFFNLTQWKDLVTGYGPAWVYLSSIPVVIFKNNLVFTILGMKILIASFVFGSGFLIVKLSQKLNDKKLYNKFILFILSPVVLVELMINGHNDIAMIFFVLLWLWYMQAKRFNIAFTFLWIGVLIKFIPIILLPLHFSYIFWVKNSAYKLYSKFWQHFLIVLGLTFIFYLPFWNGWHTLDGTFFLLNLRGLFQASPFLALLSIYLPYRIVTGIGFAVFLTVYAVIILKYQPKSFAKLVNACIFVFVAFMLFAQWYIMPWYLVWILPLLLITKHFWHQVGFWFINLLWIFILLTRNLHLGSLLTLFLFAFFITIIFPFKLKLKIK
ncbi:MAG: hypothetical protein COT81_03140 [Candidatus Buchananbacteria bacterium CG10_big_fil_rev_8_21_14_0_10_42_9]|uniref:Glycosyltransferase RgtA/B/C/D-like domain-containing protein n=1 Tax=Candidatus Buchananbacteria bacterium CG10_big_fil_rev_8_21_14_0_10_42_9 TaxID=1974526 RepID=A0A2H0W140_9BACT|nr:MAG: hypothetical protein COT81_03140 [Candidatus Buchananbacteria bacterium CG10_big_fil_rev_8_21_14_0_10_42_9]